MKILKLTLKKPAFEVMVTGEKTLEYRKPSKWIYSRLIDQKTKRDRHYDLVEFSNGYQPNRPVFRAKFLGYMRSITKPYSKYYSNGLKVIVQRGTVIIELGEITEIENYNKK